MSASPHANPDRRALPDGWITRYDENYRAWYYVDTRAQPPRSSWDHPLNAPPPPPPTAPPSNYQPTPNAPPTRNYPGSSQSYGHSQQPGQPYSFNQGQTYPGGGYPSNQPDPRGYQQQGYPPQQAYAGAPSGNYNNQEWQQQQQGWQPQQGYPAQQSGRSGGGGGGGGGGRHNLGIGLAAGAAGLLGGALLTEGFEHHERREEEERQDVYDQGFVDGELREDTNADGPW